MKAYCLDTSGLSTPLYICRRTYIRFFWKRVEKVVVDGKFAVTTEIYGELVYLPGKIGKYIADHKSTAAARGRGGWLGLEDISRSLSQRMRAAHELCNFRYNGNRKNTVGLNDISIIALAKTLGLPVIVPRRSWPRHRPATREEIPDVREAEGVPHMSFNEFLRAEGITN